jgi:hypothetical protein
VHPNVFLTNAAPYFLWPRGDEHDQAYLLGIMNSIPFDWYARLFVEANMNYHILYGLRVPRPGKESELRQRVVEIAGRLAAEDDRYKEWGDAIGVECGSLDKDEQLYLVYELDAIVAHLYNLSSEQVEVIFETFHRGWNYRQRLDQVLEHYESWADRLG